MSICNPCVKLKPISLCSDSIVLGKAEANKNYLVWFKSEANRGLYGYAATSLSDGTITLHFPEGFPLSNNTNYEMWINEPGDSVDSKRELLIGVRVGYCFLFSAFRTQSLIDGYFDQPETQTLEVE